ncbi:MAG TPA: hydrogenase maturation nickel metallochaperone HypA [Candidatus Acidoferrales bacterium]|nr:hydrogenase maturation nickel metallochaperone HypA [Candidatus Acidoferrales bacterium]
MLFSALSDLSQITKYRRKQTRAGSNGRRSKNCNRAYAWTKQLHELSIAMSLLDEVGQAAARQGATRVLKVRLRVGELSSVVNDALQFAWELASAPTVAAGSVLEIERVAVRVYCPACRGMREPRSANFLVCSACGTPAPEIVNGRELLLVAMEVEDGDPGGRSAAVDPQEELDPGAGSAPALSRAGNVRL